ncbi:16S rRNA (guanine(966)-N(2))-methyltransferase RsmD [Vibrio anguillarum]|uniref:Ribosomal RNA small subunit methyltransferase D n=2 Tax=Vibrio TaxID=662 RepID=A0A223N0X5_9VIBR|nr:MULTISPECIES: 16S rRNA (guanine(966)-N(2))-methyltransferase RsmD [Vibrio]ASU23511.1 16S rRNA (guanine(966)-N(2))-methyltransferase RsmD [Vibrio qinghaiensis]MBF4284237.1 16S rRNA (guanine(966)-N(2))-methyltransferase RsmD [Vibrio anguillarum]MBF4288821.1 16S rRNA (guanine(966)-N(2))-methyltransferase RsmD [Vibrio anguillarum]MBF4340656.1 16S rRNA (guanine(966)-N(2))-methyltransferase RsmD [Vibrio anguillarum]MBF4355437.1 16S rRNA (guanine(966)-N(2))-methyltransferase RsmD [Vibrio anguillar
MVRRRQQNSSQNKPSTGFVRIISGLWRGRKLPVHDAQGLRPTTDRVKETLFNWLAQEIAGAHCLDLFAGSGSLGFEAASRQAQAVTLIELNPTAFKQLEHNIAALNATNLRAINSDALAFLKQQGTPHHLVFIDPPFRQGLLSEAVSLLEQNGWLADEALIYIETEKELALEGIPANWRLHREKNAGQVSYRLFERSSE